MAYLGPQVNAHRDQDVRRALAALTQLAARHRLAVVVVRHLNKTQSTHALYRGGGSIGIIGAARFGLLVAADPDDPERRILASTKANLARPPAAFTFRLEAVPGSDVARVAWLGESGHTAAGLLAEPAGDGERGRCEEAEAFLRDVLAGDPVAGKEVQRMARDAGIAEVTLRRARERLRVVTSRDGFGRGSRILWSLSGGTSDSIHAQAPHTGSSRNDEHVWEPVSMYGDLAPLECEEGPGNDRHTA